MSWKGSGTKDLTLTLQLPSGTGSRCVHSSRVPLVSTTDNKDVQTVQSRVVGQVCLDEYAIVVDVRSDRWEFYLLLLHSLGETGYSLKETFRTEQGPSGEHGASRILYYQGEYSTLSCASNFGVCGS